MDEGGSGQAYDTWIAFIGLIDETYLLTGSLMAVKKSCACSAIGENASRMIWPSSGLIHNGREA